MKVLFLVIAFFFTSLCFASNEIFLIESSSLFNQQLKEKREQFLDQDFKPGKIILKEGSVHVDKLNYHIYLNSICYYDEHNEPKILDNLSNVLVITYGKRTFLPISNTKIAEVFKTFPDGSRLLIEREAEQESRPEDKGVFGTSTITASVTKATSGIFSGQTVKFDIPDDINFTLKENLMVSKDGKNYKISSLRSLKWVYRKEWDRLKSFANENNINPNKINDLLKLLEFITEE